LLDSAIAGLGAQDREAIVLRFLDGKSMKEVGAALDASEGAAKKRVNRALEKLRVFFARRGIASTTALIALAISTHSMQAAPLGLAGTICAAAVKGSAATSSSLTLAKGALKLMAWTKVKTAGAIGASVMLATAVVERDRGRSVFESLWQPNLVHSGYAEMHRPIFSSDGRHVAYVAMKDEKWRAVVDDRDGAEYDNDLESLTLSPDGRHSAYVVRTGEKWRVVRDGKEGVAYDHAINPLVFSANGKRVAYAANTGRKWRIVVDGAEGPEYGEDIRDPIFSPDGKRVAFAGRRDGKWRVVADGRESPEYQDFVQPPAFSADGKHVGYAVEKDEKWRLVLDGQERALYDSMFPPVFSSDGKHVAYAARKGSKWRLVVENL
jgi:hypothetical protein